MNLARLRLMRCAARVTRMHVSPTIYRQSVGEHTFGIMAIVLTIWENPSIDLLKVILYHDAPESITGDVPAPVKWRHKKIAEALEQAELSICEEFELSYEDKLLTTFERKILKYADIMEFAMFACEEIDMGNRVMLTQFHNSMKAFNRLGLIDVTPEAKELYDFIKIRGERLYGDVIDEDLLPLHSWSGY